MAINVVELRKFQELFGPVLAAIPAVLDLDAQMADAERAVAAAKREYDQIKAGIEEQLRIGTEQVDAAVKRLQETEATRTALMREITDERSRAAAAAQAAIDARDAKLASISVGISEATQRAAQVDREYAKKLADAKAAHQQAVTELNDEITELLARRDAIRSSLDELKAKLG